MAAAGSCSVGTHRIGPNLKVVVWTWTSDASGDCTEVGDICVSGQIGGVKFKHDTSDTPTDDFDITIKTRKGSGPDILNGAGTDLDTGDLTSIANFKDPSVLNDSIGMYLYREDLRLAVDAAGAAKKGVVQLFLKI